MSTHLEAKQGEIAKNVLMPGDPLRAEFAAKTYLENVHCYNHVRGMLGFTGTYKGTEISIQGSGMGIPSFMIYCNELMSEYNADRVIRIGTCGGLSENIHIRDLILGSSACTTSAINKTRFGGYDFAPTADFELLHTAYHQAQKLGMGEYVHVGPLLSTDEFYGHDEGLDETYASYGVLGVEMEAAGLYTLAAKYKKQGLAICTVSDHMITGESTPSQERERTFTDMMEVALETCIS